MISGNWTLYASSMSQLAEINHFVDCIPSSKESHCNVADAVKTHQICLASEISARENRPVRLPLADEVTECA
jgi:predicted dehydrogenase